MARMTLEEYRARQQELAKEQANALAILAAGRAGQAASRHRSLHPDEQNGSDPANPVPPPGTTGENESHEILSESEVSIDLVEAKKAVQLEAKKAKKKKSSSRKNKKGKKKRRVQDDSDESIDSEDSLETEEDSDLEESVDGQRGGEVDPGRDVAPVEENLINKDAQRKFPTYRPSHTRPTCYDTKAALGVEAQVLRTQSLPPQ